MPHEEDEMAAHLAPIYIGKAYEDKDGVWAKVRELDLEFTTTGAVDKASSPAVSYGTNTDTRSAHGKVAPRSHLSTRFLILHFL